MHILIIGAAGMVGRKLTDRLVGRWRARRQAGRQADIGRRDAADRTGRFHRRKCRRADRGSVARRVRPRSWSPGGRTSSSILRPLCPARRRPISTRAIASISTVRAISSMRCGWRALGSPYMPAPRLHLLDRGVRGTIPDKIDDTFFNAPLDQLRHAEGDRRIAAVRLFAPRLLRRHRHPPAHHLHPAGQAQQGSIRLLLQHPARAAGGSRSDPAGCRRTCAIGMPALARRWVSCCMQPPWILERLGARRNLSLPGLSATVGEQIEALRRVAGEKAVKLIRRETRSDD